MHGTLKLTAVSGNFKNDADPIGKMDPYVIFQVGSQKFKTKVAKDAGATPSWNETFIFQLQGDHQLTFKIYDEDLGPDDLVGSGTVDLYPLMNQHNIQAWHPVTGGSSKKPVSNGSLLLICDFTKQGGMAH